MKVGDERTLAIISVIIPVYKVEPYLRQCIDSVINQTYQSLEIILVDDGSPDNCGRICDEYAIRDDRIRVIHKKNEGLSAARNDGLRIATGEWIAFVDSDDWCELDYYECLVASQDYSQADIICAGGYWMEYLSKRHIISQHTTAFQISNRSDIEKMMVYITSTGLPWDKIYRREFLDKYQLCYDITSKAIEDFQFNFQAFDCATCVAIQPIIGYHYRQVNMSISKGFQPQKPQINYDVISKMHDYARMRGLSPIVVQGIHNVAICMIAVSLNCCFFHPSNTATYTEKAEAIRNIKTWPYYRDAIMEKNSIGLNKRRIVLKYILRLPWIWPLKLLHMMNQLLR